MWIDQSGCTGGRVALTNMSGQNVVYWFGSRCKELSGRCQASQDAQDAGDATQDAQDAGDADSTSRASGHNGAVSEAG